MHVLEENIFDFGKFQLDNANKILRYNGEIVSLPLKSVELLCLLVENRGEVVNKQEIFERVWQDSFVEDSVLTQNIYQLRKTFEEFGEKDLIKTVPRRGYIFSFENETTHTIEREIYEEIEIIETESLPEKQVLALPPKQTDSKFKVFGLGFAALIVLTSAVFGYWFWNKKNDRATLSDIKSMAVLPLKSFDEKAVDDNLRLRMMDSLATKLGKIETISVRPTSSTMKFLTSDESSFEIGKKLLVDAVLEGSIQREENKIRVTLQLVSIKNGEQIWSEQFDGEADKLLDLQNAVSTKLLDKLNLPLSNEQQTIFAKRPTTNSGAYEEYLKGRYFWNKRTPEGLQSAIVSFEKAIQLDPNFALAHAGLADVYCVLPEYTNLPEKESYQSAQKHAIRALELDANLAEALTSLAFVEFWNNKNFAESEKNFRRAIAVNPNYPTAHHWFANVLSANKNLTESVEEMKKAQKLDPLSLVINTELGIVYYYSRQNDLAIEQFRRTLEIEPNFHRATIWFGRALTVKGSYDEALSLYKKVPVETPSNGGTISEIGLTNGLANNRFEAETLLKTLTLRPPSEKNAFSLALIYLGLGEKDKAAEHLKKAALERESDLAYIDVDPIFDPLRENDEFKKLAIKFR